MAILNAVNIANAGIPTSRARLMPISIASFTSFLISLPTRFL